VCAKPSSVPLIQGSAKPSLKYGSIPDYMDQYMTLRASDSKRQALTTSLLNVRRPTPLSKIENPPFAPTAFSLPISSTVTTQQFNSLPESVCKGGNQWKMGRGRNFVCALCLTVGHTFEFCAAKNGYIQGGPAITSNPNNLVPSPDTYNRTVEYRAGQIQSSFDVQSFAIPRANATFQSDQIQAQVQEQVRGLSPVSVAIPSPNTLVSQLQFQMIFSAQFNNTRGRVGLDTMCQGDGFLSQTFCKAASPQIPISIISSDPFIKTLPKVTTGNGCIGTAVGFAQVRMILGDFVSDVEFVVFGKFAGFDAVLGQEWLKRYQCVLDMGTGSVTISADNKKCIIRTIDTRQ
jgi:hypothetical protein